MCDSIQECNDKDNEMDLKLKKYEILYTAYADEIRNLWQRSIFLGAFMVLVWTGYGALQLKFIAKENGNFNEMLYNCASLGLCFVIIVLSLLWIAMAKGSKFVQEAHEKHIERYMKTCDCNLFCDLSKYERMLKPKLCRDLLYCGTFKPYRYSPSKINITLGWFSCWLGILMTVYHIALIVIMLLYKHINEMQSYCVFYGIAIIVAFILLCLFIVGFLIIGDNLKGGQQTHKDKSKTQKGAKNG